MKNAVSGAILRQKFGKGGYMRSFKRRHQQGQGIMEYVIITALIGIFCLIAVQQFGKHLQTRLNQMNSKIVERIQID